MVNEVLIGLGSVFALLFGIGLLWFASVRLIGKGVPFVDPVTFVQYPPTTPSGEPANENTPRSQPQRRLHLTGAANFRDLGGYQTIDGRYVRWGMIYRSEALGRLSPEDLQHLNQLGLRLICDLRTPGEISRVPDRIPQTAIWAATPAQEGDFDSSMLPTLLFNRKRIPDLMRQSYPKLLAENPQRFGAVLSRFADPDNLPAVFHCTAGKDRAGLTAALLLGSLGVPEKTIIADYTLSNLAYEQLFAVFVEDNQIHIGPFWHSAEGTASDVYRRPIMDGRRSRLYSRDVWLNPDVSGGCRWYTKHVLDRLRQNLLE